MHNSGNIPPLHARGRRVTLTNELCHFTAVDLVRLLRDREISAIEVMDAHLANIERVNPALNAIVTLVADTARAAAGDADAALARGDEIGCLHGLPVAHKDLVETRGIRTTFGSTVFATNVPDADALIVERLRTAGAITIGKTNTPEFGAGSQTFNDVFGTTRNPYDLGRTCGGSSGGAAVALASGMVPIADGTDMGGSLRNPASFCNVVGLRPSPGRVAVWPRQTGWVQSLSVSGPMARTVADLALMMHAISGADPRDPLSFDTPPRHFSRPLQQDFIGTTVAWSRDLGGLPVDPRVTAVIEGQRMVFEDLGCVVEDMTPDLRDADQIFRTWRAWYFELAYGAIADTYRDALKDTVVWNIEEGRRLTGVQLADAARRHTDLHERVRAFMDRYSFLVLPVSQVPPFEISKPYVTKIDGRPLETYIDWMRSCYYISVTGLPAISVPCGFTPEGWPVGVQIVGRHRNELELLQLAYAFEQATDFGRRRPDLTELRRHNRCYSTLVTRPE